MSWTEGRISAFIRGALRAGAKRWPEKFIALERAFVGVKRAKSGRMAKHYKCAYCEGEFPSKEINMDHIDPVVDPYVGFQSWDDYISRLFVGADKYQALCVTCHTRKSNEEKRIAKENKRKPNAD